MSGEREGPSVRIDACCSGCRYERSKWYAVQGDSGHKVYCDHPTAAGRRIGDTTWSTPPWCPLIDVAIDRLISERTTKEPTP